MAFVPKRVPTRRRIGRFAVGIGVLLLVLAASIGSPLLVDWLWFSAVGYESVFLTIFRTKVLLFAAGALGFLALFAVNLGLARRLARQREDLWDFIASLETRRSDRFFYSSALAVGGLLAVFLGSWLASHWDEVARWTSAVPFDVPDPLFGRDIGFYVFQLPILRLSQTWLLVTGFVLLLTSVVVYFYKLILPQLPSAPARGDLGLPEVQVNLSLERPIKLHLSVLGALVLLCLAAGFWLEISGLVYSTRGVAFGASYTDATIYQNVLKVLAGLSLVGAIAVVVNGFLRGAQLTIVAVGLIAVTWLVGGNLLPALIQRLEVQPNELTKERPYIENNIRMTRLAYQLDAVEEQSYSAAEAVTPREVAESPGTMKNIRLWDPQPLQDTYNQIQSIRPYYQFHDTDVDRYQINGEYRQVMLSARELSPERLQQTAQTWVNQRLQYTHGYGLVMSPVNEVTPEGLPILYLRDVPPQGVLAIDRPEIYYGERATSYVIVNTREAEFDYPKGDENVFTRYQGRGGVRLDSFFPRLLFSLYFADVNILLSDALTPESQILFNRQFQERAKRVAPFLLPDADPYLVIDGGRLLWIQDAYTYTNAFPYAQPSASRRAQFNYLRNSVKIVTDAYSGQMTFYLAESEPLIQAYNHVFPGLFRPLAEMPESLRAHLRYPEDLFKEQADIYRTYHMVDPRVFYNKEDLWQIPNEIYLNERRPMQPYYVVMKLPNESREEFVLIRPYTPSGRDNMITWLAARSDGPNYGKLVAFKYPKESLVYGPMQIESRIDQDPVVSSQLTVWNQQGSRVLRGNLLVIPIGQSNLYVEPIYLQSEQSQLPELKRVILSTGGSLVMEPTVSQAIESLFRGVPTGAPAGGPDAAPAAGTAPGVSLTPDQARQLAQTLRDRATSLRRELDALERDLARLTDGLGSVGGAAAPSPSGSPEPAASPVPAGR
ncbi:MAG TPA: UPF0182 family protein [Dehalococcoidia bacterium]|nr:UPF0182 family protein [Dehalococcoidia bacterium]